MSNHFDPAALPRLFHGTPAALAGRPRCGAYDRVFWTAAHSAVAQCYIPAAGSSVYLSVCSHQLGEYVAPDADATLLHLARQVGPVPFVTAFDPRGRARSWRIPPGCVRYRDLVAYVQDVLGYANECTYPGDFRCAVRTGGWARADGPVFYPADYRMPGSLVILDGFQRMRFLDLSTGQSDLTDLQYHRVGMFGRAEAAGFDGVVIDDFVQSGYWGAVGHRSVGFFASALARLRLDIIPCVRFDWDERGLGQLDTPEYGAWLRTGSGVGLSSARSGVACAAAGEVALAA